MVDALPVDGEAEAADEGPELGRGLLLERAGSLSNLEIRCGTQAGGWYADNWIALFDDQRQIVQGLEAVEADRDAVQIEQHVGRGTRCG